MPAARFALHLLLCASCACGLLAAEPQAARGEFLCEVDGGCRSDAALGLLQLATQPQAPRLRLSDFARLFQVNTTWPSPSKEENCKKYPTLCAEPFNCFDDPLGPADYLDMMFSRIATTDGHANVRSWCSVPIYDDTVAKYCIATPDLVKNAHLDFDQERSIGLGQPDASYCFLEGHCVNRNATVNTTLAEAEALCDAKYGHKAWTTLALNKLEFDLSMVTWWGLKGMPNRKISSFWGKMACAMGNFHCDVIYCQETYCKMPEYRSKYEHFLKEYGWA